MPACESCGASVDPGLHLELEYATHHDGPELLAARLCSDCSSELATHPVIRRAIELLGTA